VPALTRKASMRISIRLGLTALMAAMLLASALSTASARNLEITSATNFRVTWSRLELAGSFVNIRCQVTMEGSFHSRTIPKVQGLLIGSLTRITFKEESCSGGTAHSVRQPPWHFTYEGFTGRLPNIETVRFLFSRFLFALIAFGVTCTYGSSTDNLTFSAGLNAAGEVTNLVPLRERSIYNLLEGGGLCPPNGTLVGSATDGISTTLNSTTRIRVRLI